MERLKNSLKVVGLKQSCKAVARNRAELAYLAEDTEPYIAESFKELCEEKAVEVIPVPTGKELAKACKVEVSTACAVILKTAES
ncbi:MAG: ribosomal L7Ae/L30e/S12e/Gadd45 family protein [Clostridia bacterium]|nr:ribosomal L7Ae/L30e/S12e/Gadd45 family protein [Clostridia bacterium]